MWIKTIIAAWFFFGTDPHTTIQWDYYYIVHMYMYHQDYYVCAIVAAAAVSGSPTAATVENIHKDFSVEVVPH